MRRFIVLALLFLAMAMLNGKSEVAQECVCKEGEENCACPALAQEDRSVAKVKVTVKTRPMTVRRVVLQRKKVVRKVLVAKRQVKLNKVKIIKLKKVLSIAPPPKKKVIRQRIALLKQKNVVLKAKIHIGTKKAAKLRRVVVQAKHSGNKVVPVPVKLLKSPAVKTKKVLTVPFAVQKVRIIKGQLKRLVIAYKINKKTVRVLKQKVVVAPGLQKAKLKRKIVRLKQKGHITKVKIVHLLKTLKQLQKGVKVAMRTGQKVVVVRLPIVKHKKYTILRSYKIVPVETAVRRTEFLVVKYKRLKAINKGISKRVVKLKLAAKKAPLPMQPRIAHKIQVLKKKQAKVQVQMGILRPQIKRTVKIIKHKKLVKIPLVKVIPLQEKPAKKYPPPKPLVVEGKKRIKAKSTLCKIMFAKKKITKLIKKLKFKIKVVPPKKKQVIRKRLLFLKQEAVMLKAKAKIAQYKKEEASKRLLRTLKKKIVVLKSKVAHKLSVVAKTKQKFKVATKKLRKIQIAFKTATPQRRRTLKRFNKVARAQFVQTKRDLKMAIKIAVRYVAKTQHIIAKAKKRALILAKERCRTLVQKLAKSQRRVIKVSKQLKKYCQKTSQKIPRPALVAATGLQKVVAKGTLQAQTLRNKIKIAISTVLNTGKKVSVESCRELEAQLRASAARAKALEQRLRTSCKKSLKRMPPKLKAKIHKLKTTLTKVTKRASLLKSLVTPALARPTFPMKKRFVRAKVKKVALKIERKINYKIKSLLRAARVAPPPERKVIMKKVKYLARNKKYIAKKMAIKRIAAAKPLPPPVYKRPFAPMPILAKPRVIKPGFKPLKP